jgi:hypothetical protein
MSSKVTLDQDSHAPSAIRKYGQFLTTNSFIKKSI